MGRTDGDPASGVPSFMPSASVADGRDPDPPSLTPLARWRLAARLLAGSGRGWWQAGRFLARGLADRKRTGDWLAHLASPDLIRAWQASPELATRLQGEYLDLAWTETERLDALVGHHGSLAEFFGPLELEALYLGLVPLVRLRRPGGQGRVEIVLGHRREWGRCGELVLAVTEPRSGGLIAALTFSFTFSFGRRVILIGGLHAETGATARELVHELPRDMHGLRPKALALWALQELGSLWRIEAIHAVPDARAVRPDRARGDWVEESGDQFWLESDGRRLPDGAWELPRQFRPRSREELKPSRRRTHERRYAMLASLRPLLLEAGRAVMSNPAATGLVQPPEFLLEPAVELSGHSAWPMPLPPSTPPDDPDLMQPGEVSPIPAS